MTYLKKEENLISGQLITSAECFGVNCLTLTNYRNYSHLRIKLTDDPVIVTGPNGSGKTNLLEALSLFAPGRGLRHAKLSHLARAQGDGGWGVNAKIATPQGQVTIGTGYSLPKIKGSRDSRIVQIDNAKKVSQNSLPAYVNVIWLTPQMDGIFNGPPSERRSFFDRLVSSWDPLHQGRINSFKTKMRERLFLLAKSTKPDFTWISSLENSLTDQGIAIAAARLDFLSRIDSIASKGLNSFPGVNLSLVGDLEHRLQDSPAIKVEDWFRESLKKNRALDLEAGKTILGPHRTDLKVFHIPKKQTAELCSTGEQKALLVGIILAHARLKKIGTGFAPLLLLDEIAAHLDEGKRQALFDNLNELGGQIWFTGTDTNLFKVPFNSVQMLKVDNGIVTHS